MERAFGPSPLDNKEFELFRNIVFKESGIKLSEVKNALVQARLMKRLRVLRLRSYSEYYNFLMENYDEEKINLINCITTNKTDFFREEKHFEYMNDVILPEYEEFGKNILRIWSAGSSTGEEAYSIAITLFEYYTGKNMPNVKILATDIDTQVLKKGVDGIYKGEDLDGVSKQVLSKYFLMGKRENEGQSKVKEFVKKKIYFRRLNLQDAVYPMKRKFDIIFCRNVVIYFDEETRRNLYDKFYNILNDDGYLFVGHSETLNKITDKFHLIKNTIYRKLS